MTDLGVTRPARAASPRIDGFGQRRVNLDQVEGLGLAVAEKPRAPVPVVGQSAGPDAADDCPFLGSRSHIRQHVLEDDQHPSLTACWHEKRPLARASFRLGIPQANLGMIATSLKG